MPFSLPKLALAGLVAGLALAHPGEEHHQRDELQALSKREFQAAARRGLASCADKLEARDYHGQAAARRAAKVDALRQRRGIVDTTASAKRDAVSVNETSHLSTAGYTPDTSESVIFASNSTCVLNPEGETGPFYVPGELVRSDLTEGQEGVAITVEAQFLDVETCEPVTDLYWDLWNCNSTGVYSGVQEQGNGNADDAGNLDTTFLRGLGAADAEGVVSFDTLFPGHYAGRATHHHIVAHVGASVLANGTLSGGSVAHVGQLFWDQDLIEAVEATAPYASNTIEMTANIDDRVFTGETDGSSSDPVFEYVYLGDSVEEGLFGWITIAVNVSATYDPKYSFVYTAGGGVAESGGSTM